MIEYKFVVYFLLKFKGIDWLTELIVDTMVASKQLEENLKEKFVETMLIRHRHQNQKKPQKLDENGGTLGSKIHLPLIRSIAEIGRKSSETRGFHKHGNKYKDTEFYLMIITPHISSISC